MAEARQGKPGWLDWRSWLASLAIYRDPRVVGVLFLGFSSGLPIMLIAATLSTWLREEEVTRAAIGLFGFAFAPYTFKFAWAPLMDRLPLPPFTSLLGRRRGWMIAAQIGLVLSIFALGRTSPAEDLWWTAFFAVLVAFFSASQDIVIDAYRVEILPKEKLGAGAGVVVLGYRVAMWVATAGALLIAEAFGWSAAYTVMALLVLVGMGTVLSIGEPAQSSTALIDQEVLEEDRLLRQTTPARLAPFKGLGGLLLAAVIGLGVWQPLSTLFGIVTAPPESWSISGAIVLAGNLAVTALGMRLAWLLYRRTPDALARTKNFALLAIAWATVETLWYAIGPEAPFFATLHGWLVLGLLFLVSNWVVGLFGAAPFTYEAFMAPVWLTVVGFWLELVALLTLYGFTYFSRRAQANFGMVPIAEESRVHLWMRRAVIEPFYDFVRRNGLRVAVVILAFISVYKAADVVLTLMANPFYIDVGFDKAEIAWVSGTFGLWMTLIGGILGGVLVFRLGLMLSLALSVALMAGSNLMFLLLSWVGPNLALFHAVILVENVTAGLGTTVFVAYLSSLCNIHYTAVQYALLTSFMQLLGKFVIVPSSGFFADAVGWSVFFLTSTLFALPALFLLWLLWRWGLAVETPAAARA
ncbi:MAG: MFS transporter [Geminicoccaceae bacterium]|nr:MFS transporter [Geminicoccaceae bacterium]MCB9968523.1 MFS transporter [Geminicoccaceae bacterium]